MKVIIYLGVFPFRAESLKLKFSFRPPQSDLSLFLSARPHGVKRAVGRGKRGRGEEVEKNQARAKSINLKPVTTCSFYCVSPAVWKLQTDKFNILNPN